MATLPVRKRGDGDVGDVEVSDAVFACSVKSSLLHEAVRHQLASRRRGTHNTKTRSEVRGGGRKPWRQKGTGRARHGSIRSPIWRHGGVVFGPKPRDYGYAFPKQKKRRALQMALSAKAGEEEILVVDSLEIEAPKTREVAALLSDLGLEGKVLIYDPDGDEGFARAARNLPEVTVVTGYGLTVYDLLWHDVLLTTEAGIARIDEELQ